MSSRNRGKMKVGIIGGGITGLTTALALWKLGISSVVYEQASELNEVGAGIWLQPNAIKILDWLDLKHEIAQHGNELSKMEVTNSHLVPFKKMKSEVVQDELGNKTIAIHRAKLQTILHNQVQDSCQVLLGKKYISHSVSPQGISVQFENGTETVDILLGADGINSKVRAAIAPGSNIRSSEQICWRGVSKISLPLEIQKIGREAWGKQIRFGFSQINEKEVYWFAVASADHVERVARQDKKQYLLGLFQEFSPIVTNLISNTELTRIHEALLCDLEKIPSWYAGNVCLIGDAAHATTPNMGQGACQGIEDAYYLSNSLSNYLQNPEKAFQKFQDRRRKKVDYVVNTSWQIGKMAHSKIAQPLVKLMMKITPERVLSSQMNKLFAVDM